MLISADGSSSDVADRLCSEYMRLELLGEQLKGSVVVLDCGMTREERRRCDEFCLITKNVHVCSPDELRTLTEKILKK